MKFKELLDTLMAGDEVNTRFTEEGIEGFKAYINTLEEIRVYVDGTPNFGHQASSVHVLKRLIDETRYDKKITVVYRDSPVPPSSTERTTPQKLATLLTGLDPDKITKAVITYGACSQISFVPYSDNMKLSTVDFGITGGADEDSGDNSAPIIPNLAKALNTRYFLRLQPFAWRYVETKEGESVETFEPNRIEFNDSQNPEREPIDIGEQNGIFNLLAYYFDPRKVCDVDAATWTWYETDQSYDEDLKKRTAAAHVLLDALTSNTLIKTQPVYGLHHEGFKPGEILLNLLCAQRQLQAQVGHHGPIVVPVFHKDTNGLVNTIEAFQNGTDAMRTFLRDTYEIGSRSKEEIMEGLLSALYTLWSGTSCEQDLIFIPDATKEPALAQIIATLEDRKILLVLVGSLPGAIFNAFFSRAGLPCLFEGQGTSSLVISQGKPYLQIPRDFTSARNYPTLDFNEDGESPISRECASVAKNLTINLGQIIEEEKSASLLTENTKKLCAMLKNSITDGSDLSAYFNSLRVFYQQAIHDKFLLGCTYIHGVISARIEPSLLRQRAGVSTDPLATLYQQLSNAWSEGQLDLLKALPDSRLAKYYGSITGSTFTVKLAKDDIVKESASDNTVTRVLLRNATSPAFKIGFDLQLTFAVINGLVVSDLRCRVNANWALDGAQWLGFEEPGFDMRVTEAAIPVQGEIRAKIIGTGMTISVGYPVYNSLWRITGDFAKPYPGIANFFQMAGGINLVQVLPPPLNALAGLGLVQSQLSFDAAAKSITSCSFTVSTNQPWSLISTPAISVTPTLSVTVLSPADLKNRSVLMNAVGTFMIGKGTIVINARYPDFQVSGQLTSGVIELGDLARLFGADINLESAVSEFSMQVLPTTGSYSVATKILSDWSIPTGKDPLFKITGLGFHVAGGKNRFEVSLSGAVDILPGSASLALALSAKSLEKGWLFEGKQTSESLKLGDLLKQYLGWETEDNLQINGLALSVNTGNNAWSFSAKTATPWTVPFIPGLSVAARFKAGHRVGSKPVKGALRVVGGTAMQVSGDDKPGDFARIETDWTWQGIKIQVWYDYNPDVSTYGITWNSLQGSVSSPDKVTGDRVALLKFTDNVTLGSIIETMIIWMTGTAFTLDAPWNVLDTIKLSNIGLKYIFNSKDKTRNKVTLSVRIGPIDLGFARIDGIDLGYQSTGPDKGVMVTLNGSFPWNVGDKALGDTSTLGPWDASKPGTAPAPSGNGNKYFDLRLLALGQHVTAPGFATAQTVQQAIAVMRELPDAEFGKIPQIAFDPSSDWLVGMEFGVLKLGDDSKKVSFERGLSETPQDIAEGVLELLEEQTAVRTTGKSSGYAVTLQVIFNDPRIYGLRIALEGEPAKIFKGLDFQIMYRQISDTVGVYQAEITLPDVMRFISVGAYSITLPVFAIAIYTNGDFQVDIGFPWNSDFTRSFSIEAIIYPGIPVLGSAGFYFGKLSSATTDRVPKITNGTFNPVLVFGFGLQVGFGKSIRYGILSAGFSLTAVGILEGVIAKFNPYQLTGPDSNNKQIQGAYYFWLRGTVGIIGKLFGTIDFAIIKANVNVEIRLLLELTYESYVSIAMTVLASVDVSVSIKIDLGLFSIKISFSFSMRIKESFTIANTGKAPWALPNPTVRALRARTSQQRLRALRSRAGARQTPTWSNLQPAASKLPLSGYASVGLTMARDEWGSPRQLPCYVTMLFIDSVAAANDDRTSAVLKAAGNQPDSPFEALAKMVLRWAVAAVHGSPVDAATLDATPVCDKVLATLADQILASSNSQPTPIDPDDFARFLAAQFEFTVGLPPATEGEAHGTFFPMPGGAQLTIPAYGTQYSGSDYRFADYNQVSTAALAGLRSYFDELAIKVQQESAAGNSFKATGAGATLSMSQWIFADYALLLARQMVQAVREALRDFKFAITAGQTPEDIVRWVNQNIGVDHDLYESQALFIDNAEHPLTAGHSLIVGQSVTVDSQPGNSFELIAQALELPAFNLAVANADTTTLLKPGQLITYPDKPDYVLVAGDSLLSVAGHFSVLLADLLNASNLLRLPDLLLGNATLRVPGITSQSQQNESFTGIANRSQYRGRFDARTLALVNSGQAILRPGASVTFTGQPPLVVQPRDTLGDLANRLKNVSVGQFIDGSDVLSLQNLLLPVAVVQLPSMSVPVEAGQTLSSIARFFGTSVQTLANNAANSLIKDLFATVDDSGTAYPTLDITHLPAFTLGELINEAQRCHALQHLSGMASRYYLHGLRLQTDNIVPMTPGMWVRDGSNGLQLPPLAGLFALTGQQFPLPAITADAPFSVTLKTSAALPWLNFQDAKKTPVDSLTLSIAAGSDDANRISSLSAYATAGLAIDLEYLGAADMAQSKPATYACSSPTTWQCAAEVAVPYGTPLTGVAAMRLWRLPDALCALPDPVSRAIDPRLAVKLAQYDQASGATRESAVNAYGWASNLSFAVKRVPASANSPASAATYEIVGADGVDITLLERLITANGNNDNAFFSLSIGYAPDQSGPAAQGVETASPAGITLGIAQVNLSTETRPPANANNAVKALLRQDNGLGLLNRPSEFVRLLWEASITRSGGFFLYYYDAEQGAGLPDRLFNDRGEASLSLILIYSQPASASEQNRVANYMNSLVTADAFNTGNTALFVEADPARSPPDSCVGTAQDTLASIAYRYFCDAGELAVANADLKLSSGVSLAVNEGVYRIAPAATQTVAEVAQRFACSVAALQAANGNQLKDPLSYPLALRLPNLLVTVGTNSQISTLNEIAATYGQSVIALAGNNLDLPGLFHNQTLTITGGPTLRNATVPPGVVSLSALRAVPPAVPLKPANGSDADYAKALLLNVYNLLNYQVAANNGFVASHLGLPAGPTSSREDPQNLDKVAVARALAPGDKGWNYQQAVPFNNFAKNRSDDSPYSGIGDILQVQFNWQDLYGNVLLTGLSDPSVDPTGPLNFPPVLAGYSDALIGLGQWPSVSSRWQLLPDTSAQARLQLDLSFDASQFSGVLQASAQSATSITVQFTDTLLQASAENVANYKLGNASVLSAKLASDLRTVVLTVEPLLQDMPYELSINNLLTRTQQAVSGRAEFSYPDQPSLRSSTVQQSAVRALRVYSQLQLQLSDPHGIRWELETSLLQPDAQGRHARLPVPADQVDQLSDWLFGNRSILALLTDRAAFGLTAGLPDAALTFNVSLPLSSLNPAQIFSLESSLCLTRMGDTVLEDLATTVEIRQTSTRLAPAQSAVSATNSTLVLDTFATNLTAALQVPGVQFSLATGGDRFANSQSIRPLWVLRTGLDKAQPIAYTIDTAGAGKPTIFAPRPIANSLESRKQVPIPGYVTGKGLSSPDGQSLDFIDIDLDNWGRVLFSNVDGLLTPSFTAAMEILARFKQTDYLGQLLDVKKSFANIAKRWMVPVFENDSSDPTHAQEAYYQQLLGQLSNAYSVRASIGYKAKVNASVSTPPPRLFGSVLSNPLFTAAVIDPADSTHVTLYFNLRMSAQAADTQWYSLSDGTQVLTAQACGDGSQVSLTLSRGVAISTNVQISAALTDAQGYALKPPYSQPLTLNPPRLQPNGISLSSPKLTLANGDETPLVFLVSAPDLVRGSEGEVIKSVDLDLRYQASDIEHQIGSLPNIEGDYEASSWLRLVLPEQAAPLHADLGAISVPLPLRAFPTTPTLSQQQGITDNTATDLDRLVRWDYAFTYNMACHYPQDRVYGSVTFNTAGSGLLKSFEDAFAPLAQFITVYPKVREDIEAYLAGIDATTDPVKDQTTVENATVALESAIALLQCVADAGSGSGLIMAARTGNRASNNPLTYSFTLEEGSIEYAGNQAVLCVSLIGDVPTGLGLPWVDVSPQTYTPVLLEGNDSSRLRYVYRHNKFADHYLAAQVGQLIGDRTLRLPGAHILQRQSAATEIYLKRNEELVPGRITADPFIYQTPQVKFSNPLFPQIDSSTTLPVETMGSGAQGTVYQRSLSEHLQALFDTLLASNVQPSITVQVEATYTYDLNPNVSGITVTLPIAMQAPMTSTVEALPQMVSVWSAAIQSWFDAQPPSGEGGTLWFDLSLMSDLTPQPMPLLRLRRLALDLKAITPALPVT